jgi:hypothetical protein
MRRLAAVLLLVGSIVGCKDSADTCAVDAGPCTSRDCPDLSGNQSFCVTCPGLPPFGPYPTKVTRSGGGCEFRARAETPDGSAGSPCGVFCVNGTSATASWAFPGTPVDCRSGRVGALAVDLSCAIPAFGTTCSAQLSLGGRPCAPVALDGGVGAGFGPP